MQDRQEGFGAIAVIVVALIVAVIGAAGWMVYQKTQHKAGAGTTAASQAPAPSEGSKDSASGSAANTSVAAQELTYSKVPADLQAAILEETKSRAPGCVSGNMIVDANNKPTDQEVRYRSDGFASTGIGCDSGAIYIFAKSAGKWLTVTHASGTFPCAPLEQYKVPSEIFPTDWEAQCYNAPGGPDNVVAYSQR